MFLKEREDIAFRNYSLLFKGAKMCKYMIRQPYYRYFNVGRDIACFTVGCVI